MKVCVVGAGAVGGLLGTRLALTGEADVAALARHTTLVALRDHGWRLESEGQTLSAPAAQVADDPRALGEVGMCGVAVDTLRDVKLARRPRHGNQSAMAIQIFDRLPRQPDNVAQVLFRRAHFEVLELLDYHVFAGSIHDSQLSYRFNANSTRKSRLIEC